MSKKEQVQQVPLEMFQGRYIITVVTGQAFEVEIIGAFKDAWMVKDVEGEEGIIPFHAVVLVTELKKKEEEEKEHEEG
jgi:hypothetical protein